MSKPSTLTWATDTNIATGTEAGTPTKVAPSAGFIAQGLVPGDTFVGPYFNWLLNAVCGWLAYLNLSGTDELTYANTRTRTKVFNCRGAVGNGKVTGGNPDEQAIAPAGGGGFSLQVTASSSGASAGLPMHVLPEGAILTGVRVIAQNDALSTGGGLTALSVQLKKNVPVWSGSPGPGSDTPVTTAQTFTGTATTSVKTWSISETIDPAAHYYFDISGPGVTLVDWVGIVYAYELTWTETRATGHY